jgi:S1-C subfamily serine protease
MKQSLIIFTLCLLGFTCTGELLIDSLSDKPNAKKSNRNNFINDNYYINSLKIKIAEFAADSSSLPISEVTKQLERKVCKLRLNIEQSETPFSYDKIKHSVLAIGELYKCKKCPAGHIASATAFVISEDGICVSNYHVFDVLSDQKASIMGIGVINFEGKVFRLQEILAANKEDDVIIFKIDTEGEKLTPLPLNQLASIGDEVKVISHPKKKFYAYSEGVVTRKHMVAKINSPRYTISADYAQGSSGGPVFDKNGNVIGVIESTLSLYSSDKHIQMVMKDIIPIQCVLDLISE